MINHFISFTHVFVETQELRSPVSSLSESFLRVLMLTTVLVVIAVTLMVFLVVRRATAGKYERSRTG